MKQFMNNDLEDARAAFNKIQLPIQQVDECQNIKLGVQFPRCENCQHCLLDENRIKKEVHFCELTEIDINDTNQYYCSKWEQI